MFLFFLLLIVVNLFISNSNVAHCLLPFPTINSRHQRQNYQKLAVGIDIQAPIAKVDEEIKTEEESNIINNNFTETMIIPPGGSFRKSLVGELSITSYNILAPSYHFIGKLGGENGDDLIKNDRQNRVPWTIEIAKETNADILCLQEVEGGNEEIETVLRQTLAKSCSNSSSPGYDSYIWTPLNPNRINDAVGLCVAWRSKKHNLLSSELFRRGMVLQLKEIESGATFCIGNVHLPAKPQAITGRLKTMSTAIKQTERYEPIDSSSSSLNGAVIMTGDFNSDQYSDITKLLKTGFIKPGTLKNRSYRALLEKRAAYRMQHKYHFRDSYGDTHLRKISAPITVSPKHFQFWSCMDHILYASHFSSSTTRQKKSIKKIGNFGKNKTKRQRKKMRDNPTRFNTKATKEEDKDRSIPFQVDSILATVLPDQNDRLEIIQNGLPNINAGFPSDHLPIGAMFVQDPSWKKAEEVASSNSTITKESDSNGLKKKEKSDIQMERESYLNSLIVIRRHNAILQTITEWLVSRGAKDIISHQPLYRWKWLKNDNKSKFKRKGRMRAPDLCCVLADSVLVIVEITATTKPDQMRQQKLDKYKDLPEILLRAPLIANMESPKLSVWDETFVILLDENGNLPEATVKDLNQLTKLSSSSSNSSEDILERDSKEIFDRLQKVFLDTNSTTKW